METSIYGIKTILSKSKARVELYLYGDILEKELNVDEIINLLNEYKVRSEKLKGLTLEEIVAPYTEKLLNK